MITSLHPYFIVPKLKSRGLCSGNSCSEFGYGIESDTVKYLFFLDLNLYAPKAFNTVKHQETNTYHSEVFFLNNSLNHITVFLPKSNKVERQMYTRKLNIQTCMNLILKEIPEKYIKKELEEGNSEYNKFVM